LQDLETLYIGGAERAVGSRRRRGDRSFVACYHDGPWALSGRW